MSNDDSDSEFNANSENDECDSDSDEPVNEKLTLKAKKIRRSKGKWKLYYESRVFKKEWLDLFPWVEEDPDNPKLAICRACNQKIKAHKGILETHEKTKKHIRNISGSDDLEEPRQNDRPEARFGGPIPIDQMVSDDQINFFTESPVDAAHQAVTTLIDKLVEKYHENRLENLKLQNEAMIQLNMERAKLLRSENQRKLARRLQQENYSKQAQETKLKLMQMQHEVKINAMESERDAKLRAIEQELMFARQEYEKKVKLLDAQLSCMK
ncbi:uncharacterized protein LOC118190916 [Stegodyphus dumicola]|uniref:uncharacterized protein LOC118190916 n=1 Tax=Stegodyphus dumicola TaxID=202533 RepID=UPI0015B0755F|nr:uncharacterized protein LOC118190916 [Stegodyphus dumicola]